MRTRQQLGYIVNSGMSSMEKTLGLIFIIQSGEYSSDILEKRVDSFLKEFAEYLNEVNTDEFDKIKNSVLNSLLQKTSSVNEEARRLFSLAFESKKDFDSMSVLINELKRLTPKNISDVARSLSAPSKSRKLILKMNGKNHNSLKNRGSIMPSIEEFRSKHGCPDHCLP